MKKSLIIIAAIIMIAGLTNNVMAQTNTSTVSDVPATATIIAPISIAQSNFGLQFGTIVKGAGDVLITTAGIRSCDGGDVYLIPAGISTPVTQATFAVTGEGAYTFSIDLPENGDVELTDGTNFMAVNDFTSNGVVGSGDTEATLVAGTFSLNVGATLTVDAAQVSGFYQSTFDVTVAYN